MSNNVPNLDCESYAFLTGFWQLHQGGRNADMLGLSGKGSRNATRDLANYAMNKATAMHLREQGKVAIALQYEEICDAIYSRLPESVRW